MRSFKYVAYIILLSVFITGCSDTKGANDANQNDLNPLDPTRNQTENTEMDDKLGYVKYSKDELDNSTARDKQLTVDRNEMADNITRMILHNDSFLQVATLVTDNEVLIAYLKKDEVDSKQARNIAKQSAVAIIPRYYEVYVSENDALIRDIESLHNSSVLSNDYSKTLNRIIDEMENEKDMP